MFNNMKNKIRLRTGEDVPEFDPQSSRTHSFHGSQSSLSSITSELNPTQSQMPNKIFDKDASELARVNPLDLASKFKKEFRACEQEWLKKEKHYESRLLQANKDLQESISSAESTYKQLEKCQNEKSDLEKHQLQEITKVKSLLLEKETENESLRERLKVAEEKNNRMGDELMKLRPLEEKVESCRDDMEFLRHTSEKERWDLTCKLIRSEETINHLESRIALLMEQKELWSGDSEISTEERIRCLLSERDVLERKLEELQSQLLEIKTSWSNKITTLETQVGRLSRQAGEEGTERRLAERKICELESSLKTYKEENEKLTKKVSHLLRERDDLAEEMKQLLAADVSWSEAQNAITLSQSTQL